MGSSTATFPIFDALADEIDALQDDVVSNAVPATLEHIFRLKTELVSLRHVIAPSREVFSQLTSREFDLIGEFAGLLLPGRLRPPDPADRRVR